jgi:hypothetical protein
MGEIFTAAGNVAAASISAGAVKEATQAQINALQRQKEFVYNELQPEKIGAQATQADVERVKNRLALQASTDPALLATRYAAQQNILQGVQGLNTGNADVVAQQAAQEALAGSSGDTNIAKQKLIDAALKEIDAGASLPNDLQAELVKAGLERSGMVTRGASPGGVGGTIARQLIGSAGLQLQKERQGRAAALTQAAQGLETQRASLLGSLFPALKQTQLANLGGAQSAFGTANTAVPEAGLGGSDIANIWLARVGATNQLAQSAADAAARGGLANAQIWNNALGSATNAIGSTLPKTNYGSLFGNIFSSPGGKTGISDADVDAYSSAFGV